MGNNSIFSDLIRKSLHDFIKSTQTKKNDTFKLYCVQLCQKKSLMIEDWKIEDYILKRVKNLS